MSKLYGPIRAGRAFRESDSSNSVVATATPGDITITENDDGLIHFNWNNRQTQTTDVVSSLHRVINFRFMLDALSCLLHRTSSSFHLMPPSPKSPSLPVEGCTF